MDVYFHVTRFSCQITEDKKNVNVVNLAVALSPITPYTTYLEKKMQDHCMQWMFWQALKKKFPSFSWKLENSQEKLAIVFPGDIGCQRRSVPSESTLTGTFSCHSVHWRFLH